MITQKPNTPAGYNALFKQLAEWHINIQHADVAAERFVIINEAMVNPFKGIDISELIHKQRSVLSTRKANQDGLGQKLLMVLVEWASDLYDLSTRPTESVDGAFLLLGKVAHNDWRARDTTMDFAKETGVEIITWLKEFFYTNVNYELLDNVQIDPIGPLTTDNLYGYRFDFTYTITRALAYDAANFGGNLPTKL